MGIKILMADSRRECKNRGSTRRYIMQQTNRAERHLLVSVLANEAEALRAYRILQLGGVSPENMAIVGAGYRDCDAVGFARPTQVARTRAYRTAAFTSVVGAIMGLAFLFTTGIQVFPNLYLNILLALTTAGISGAVGGFLVGGGVGLVFESGESIAYRNKVNQGKYLLLVEGAESLVIQSEDRLKSAPCESSRRYYFRPPSQVS